MLLGPIARTRSAVHSLCGLQGLARISGERKTNAATLSSTLWCSFVRVLLHLCIVSPLMRASPCRPQKAHLGALQMALSTHLDDGAIALRLAFILGNVTLDRHCDCELLAFDLGGAALLERSLVLYSSACGGDCAAHGSGAPSPLPAASGAALGNVSGGGGGGAPRVAVGAAEVATKIVRLIANVATTRSVGRYLAGRRAVLDELTAMLCRTQLADSEARIAPPTSSLRAMHAAAAQPGRSPPRGGGGGGGAVAHCASMGQHGSSMPRPGGEAGAAVCCA